MDLWFTALSLPETATCVPPPAFQELVLGLHGESIHGPCSHLLCKLAWAQNFVSFLRHLFLYGRPVQFLALRGQPLHNVIANYAAAARVVIELELSKSCHARDVSGSKRHTLA